VQQRMFALAWLQVDAMQAQTAAPVIASNVGSAKAVASTVCKMFDKMCMS